MKVFTLRPSLKSVQLIARLERTAGKLEVISSYDSSRAKELMARVIRRGSEACLALDNSSPAGASFSFTRKVLSNFDEKSIATIELEDSELIQGIANLVGAHQASFEFSIQGLKKLNSSLIVDGNETAFSKLRSEPASFSVPGNPRLFDSPPGFQVELRFKQLINWTEERLSESIVHPLYTIGVFYLAFLQLQPFTTGSHRTVILAVWHLLNQNGFSSLRYSHFACVLLSNQAEYHAALRQAERTANQDWSTVNIWLELFLTSICEANTSAEHARNKLVGHFRLTAVQKKIVEAVKENGSLTRSKICELTAINISTIKYNLGVLTRSGQLKRLGGGRSTSYSID